MPAGYIEGIMDAAADGMSMAIRLKSAGCTIHTPADTGSGKKGRKRAAAAASADDQQQQQQQQGTPSAAKRPNYCSALDFGSFDLDGDSTEEEEEEEGGSTHRRSNTVVHIESSSEEDGSDL